MVVQFDDVYRAASKEAEPFAVALEARQVEMLQRVAAAWNVSVSEILRSVIAQFLHNPSVWELTEHYLVPDITKRLYAADPGTAS